MIGQRPAHRLLSRRLVGRRHLARRLGLVGLQVVPLQLQVERAQLGFEVGTGIGVVVDGRHPVRTQCAVDEHNSQLDRRVGLEIGHPWLDRACADIALLARATEEQKDLHRADTPPLRN